MKNKDLNLTYLINEELTKSNFIGSFFSDYSSNLDLTGQVALSVLVLNQALLSALSTIVFIFYGEILLKKYNIETR